jgi:transposase InsO family protein
MNGRSRSPRLEVGAKLHFEGCPRIVEGFEGGAVRLQDPRGRLALVSVRALVAADDFEVLDDDTAAPDDAVRGKLELGRAELDNLPPEALEKARNLAAHLHEVNMGARHDGSEEAAVQEILPRMEHDTERTTLSERMAAKAIELGVSESALWKLRRRYMESGLYGLVDRRALRVSTAADRLDRRLREALLQVMHEHADRSNVSRQRIISLALRRVVEEHGPDAVKIPSRGTLYRAVEHLSRNMGTFGSAKNRRSIANRPKTAYRRFTASRPGEVVLMDTTPLDVYALDPATLSWVGLDLTLALDFFTRSILAWRFTPRGAKGVDAALLLRDLVTPRVMRPGWPEETRWPYYGVPETVVLDAFGGDDGPLRGAPPAGVPLTHPENMMVDRGLIYKSETFLDACRVLGISVMQARPYTPTDKAQIERAFRTIRQSLLENLPGYKGPDVWSRGRNVERTAFYYVDEIEALFAEWVVRYYQNAPHSGLHLPGAPGHHPSPNEMYEYGVATAGFLYVPPDPDLYRELLPVVWRKIGHDGVRKDRLLYDGYALDPYRGEPYPLGGGKNRHGLKWPIRYDPRDLSGLHFKDPRDGSWHELGWVNAPPSVRPFDDTRLNYAKGQLAARSGRVNVHDEQDLARVLDEMFTRVDVDARTDPRERKIIADAFVRHGQLARDRGELALPGPTGPPRPNANHADELEDGDLYDERRRDADVDLSSVEAFRAFGDDFDDEED